VNLLDHQEEIVRGFVATYRLLHKHKDELLADAGPVAAFAEDEVRVILRRTQAYSMLAYESYHPDVLRDALDRDRLFDRLWRGSDRRPYLTRVLGVECADLSQGDIPLFTTRPSSRDLWTAAGKRIQSFLKESGLEQVRRRLGQFGEEDLQRQVWIIRGSLATVAMATASLPSYVLPPLRREADPERLLAAARAVGDRLEQVAVWKGQAASWSTLAQRKEHHWYLVPMDTGLYSGLAGMCLFLGYLGQLTGAERYTRLARGALATLRLQIDRSRKDQKAIGAFEGWGGIIYVLAHLGRLWRDRRLLAEAEQLVDLLPPLIAQDEQLDFVAGCAGCIAGLLSLQRCKPSLRTLAAARLCGERLLERAQPMAQGAAWPAPMPSRGPLTGFSHGAAGIALSLLELARATGEDRFHAQALAAIEYERGLFASAEGNWPNLSLAGGGDPETLRKAPINFLVSWCHGAPGIGLARLRGLRHLDDPATRTEIDVALKTTRAHGFGRNHTLCHGDLGNLELLLEAGQILNDSGGSRETRRLAGSILDSIEREGWLCATPMAVETPGLMTGLAGIGYQLLRLAESDRVPSVLTLAPPV
jgi:type 2 lantibiotic biosynthesis protein LanM